MGKSFKKYLNERRIKMAEALLRDEEMNVTEVCFAVGFNDLSYFDRVFRQAKGMTPSSYRKHLLLKKQESPNVEQKSPSI